MTKSKSIYAVLTTGQTIPSQKETCKARKNQRPTPTELGDTTMRQDYIHSCSTLMPLP